MPEFSLTYRDAAELEAELRLSFPVNRDGFVVGCDTMRGGSLRVEGVDVNHGLLLQC